jgi:hypothetical protein
MLPATAEEMPADTTLLRFVIQTVTAFTENGSKQRHSSGVCSFDSVLIVVMRLQIRWLGVRRVDSASLTGVSRWCCVPNWMWLRLHPLRSPALLWRVCHLSFAPFLSVF